MVIQSKILFSLPLIVLLFGFSHFYNHKGFSNPKSHTEKTIFYKLAKNIIPIKINQYGDKKDLLFINVHDDEFTSVEATKRILSEYGGTLIEIENNQQRNIQFRIGRTIYRVDPNCIFSKAGIRRSLAELGRTSPVAIDEAEKLGKRILQLIPGSVKYVIALHNNTPDLFTVEEYTPGNKRAGDCNKYYINPAEDNDDFFLTTEQNLFHKLSSKSFNIVLQDNKKCTDDGSLSYYCGKKNIPYINCESEHGKSVQYDLMLRSLLECIE